MLNPTGGIVRFDSHGKGTFGSSRGNRTHKGLDLCLINGRPGQKVIAPITGVVYRHMIAYAGDDYRGIVIRNEHWEVRLLYLVPTVKKGFPVHAGDVIGIAQDISERYPPKDGQKSMLPHIHMEVRERTETGYRCLRDPLPLLQN